MANEILSGANRGLLFSDDAWEKHLLSARQQRGGGAPNIPDAWGSRMQGLGQLSGGEVQKGETDGNGPLGWFKDSADAGFAGYFGGQARAAAEFMPFGNGQLNAFADYMDEIVKANSPKEELKGLDYVMSAAGNAVGSGGAGMAELGLITGLGSLAGLGGAAAGAVGVASKLPAIGRVVGLAQKMWQSPFGKYLVANVASSPLEAVAEAGNLITQMREEGYTDEEIREAALRSAGYNTAWLTVANMLEAGVLGKVTGAIGEKAVVEGAKAIAQRGVLSAGSSAVSEGGEEFVQNLIGDYSKHGNTDNLDYDAAWDAAKMGATGGAVLGGLGGGVGAYLNNRARQQAQPTSQVQEEQQVQDTPLDATTNPTDGDTEALRLAYEREMAHRSADRYVDSLVGETQGTPVQTQTEQNVELPWLNIAQRGKSREAQLPVGGRPQRQNMRFTDMHRTQRMGRDVQGLINRKQMAGVNATVDRLIAENDFIQSEQQKAIAQLERQTGKPVNVAEVINQPIPQKAMNDARIAKVVEKASQGDVDALRNFGNWSAAVRLAMLDKQYQRNVSALQKAVEQLPSNGRVEQLVNENTSNGAIINRNDEKKVDQVKPVVEQTPHVDDVDDTVKQLADYYTGAVDNDFNNSSAEKKGAVKQTLNALIGAWKTAHNDFVEGQDNESRDWAKKQLDVVHNYFINEFAKSEVVVDVHRARMLKGFIESVKDNYYSKAATKEEKYPITANTFEDNPEALLNNDRVSQLSVSEMQMLDDMFKQGKKKSETGQSKKEETPETVSSVKEDNNGEAIIRGKNPRDNTNIAETRPNPGQSDFGRSVQAPQGKGNVSDGNGERGVHGPVEEVNSELTPAQKKNAKPSEIAGHNFTITEDDNIGVGGEKTKYRNNVEAIKLLKQLEAENRLATPSEQKVLAKYVGWGGLSSVFSYGRVDPKWEAEAKEIKELLTPEELKAARASTTSAFYTPVGVTKAIWEIVERLGFKNGRVLEPSMGVGNFFGLMPENIRCKSALNGVELDSISGRIAKQLYQKANIEVTGYEQTKYPDNYFDLAISNVPFVSGLKPHDPKYNKYKLDIHNYFFAKTIDKIRSGGLICFITSTSTMQGVNDNTRIRELLKNKADLVGAIRLPTGTFKGNAGTDVDADLIILQKRESNAGPSNFNKDWLRLRRGGFEGRYGDTRYEEYNEYYADNPDMVIGTLKMGGRFGDTLIADGKGLDVAREIESRIDKLPKNIYKPVTGKRNLSSIESAKATFLAPSNTKVNAYIEKDGKAYQNVDGKMVELDNKDQKKAVDYIGLRDVVKKILAAQIESKTTDAELESMRADLNKTYDDFVKKHGYINEAKNVKMLSLDPEYGIVASIEDYEFDKKTKKVKKADKREIFTKRTVNAVVEVTKADNASDALALSLTNTGAVDVDYIAKLMGKKPAEAIKSLEGLVYKNPLTMAYETADEYLSGNVREKLELAEWSAKGNPKAGWQVNVDALRKVQPKDLIPEEISVALGTPWIPASDIEAFTAHMLETHRPVMSIKFVPALGSWTVSWNNDWSASNAKDSVNNKSKWGTNRRPFKDILEDALNQRSPVVYDTLADKSRVVNQKETTLAQQKVKEVQEAFKKWIWQDKERADRLTNYYNNNFNNWRLREYDGSHLTLPGYSAVEHQLREHQKDAVWRIMQNGNTLLAHSVGAGKTWTMQTAAMEMKRLGIAKKSMFVIPNHMLAQFENEFRRIYPNAKLLTISSENLPDVTISNAKKLSEKELKERRAEKNSARQRVLSQIATEDWDGIIISHNMFKRIPMSAEATNQFIQEQIDEMRAAIIELEASNDKSSNRLVKELEKKAADLETKLKKAINEENKDIVIPFEQLGIDQIFVDEADMFKNLGFVTKMSRIAGLSNTNSQRSTDMFMKTQYITNKNGGRGVVFATGTPISNTMAEMFTMLRYLDMQGLKEKNMTFFDNWASNFAVHETTVERSPDGQGYRQTEKFTSFTNMPELIKMFRKVADVKTREDLNLKIPKLKNDKVTVVEIEPNSALSNYIKNTVAERANAIHNRAVDPTEDNMLKLTGDLRKASLDMRLVDPTVPREVAGGKIKAVADKVFDKYQETDGIKGTQLVFCDLSTPKGKSDKVTETDDGIDDTEFSAEENVTAYEEIKKILVKKGILANEIAFIHDAKNKSQKEELFAKVRSGEIRVLIGSTEKMGAGTNIQDKLVALHHVDAPWRPRDIEQREGRILRQGNENEEVEIFNYVTKDSFDANMWEKLKNKATMINQAMGNNLSNRIIEDMDANVLTFAEVEALASGNPLMAERTMVNAELNKYATLKGNYIKQRAENSRKAEQIPGRIKQAEIAEKQAKADIKKRVDVTGDNFNLLLGKKNYNKRTDAKDALEATVRNYKNELGGIVGQIGGFDLRLRYVKAGGLFTRKGKVYEAHENTVTAELVGNNVYGCEASLGSIEYAVMHEPDRVLDQSIKAQESLKKELKSLEAEIKRPFEYEDKYQQLKKRAEEIDKELNIGNDAEFVAIDEESKKLFKASTSPEYQRSIEEILEEVEDALADKAKSVDKVGDDVVVTMNNGKRFILKIEDEIIVSDEDTRRANKEHGFSEDDDGIIEGYWAVDRNDVDGVLAISRQSGKGVAYHEVMHMAMDLALTDKERTALINAARKEAEAKGMLIDEVIADKYSEWVQARKNGKGTAFGKLFKKMQDFFYMLKALFTRIENAHNVMRKLESGEVWNREKPLYSKSAGPKFMVSEDRVSKFVNTVLNNPKTKMTLALGKVSAAEAEAIKTATGYDVAGYEHVWRSNDVKHIVNRHGEGNETNKGQIGLSRSDIAAVVKVIEAPEKIEKGSPSNGKPSIRFIKSADDGTYTVVEVVRDTNKTLMIKTMWKNIADKHHGSNALLDTSETAISNYSSTSADSLSHGTGKVKFSMTANASAKDRLRNAVVSTDPASISKEVKEQGYKGWLKGKWNNFYRDWVDKNDSLHGLDEAFSMKLGRKLADGEKIYDKVQMIPATAAGMSEALIEGDERHIDAINGRLKKKHLPWKVTLSMVLKTIDKTIMDKAHPNYLKDNGYKDWVDAFGHYLSYRRMAEMKRLHGDDYALPNGITLQELDAEIKSAPAQFAKAAKMYYLFNDNLLTILEDAGIISEDVHKLLNDKYKEYCPLMRDFSDTAAADMFLNNLTNGGRGIGNVSTVLKRISTEGSERGIINPLETTIKSVAVMMNRAERNRVGQLAVEMGSKVDGIIKEMPTPKGGNAVADPNNCIFTVMIDGKKVAYQTTQELYGPIVGYNLPAAGMVLGIAKNAARMLRTGATVSPSFIIRNLIRDTIFAGISSKNGFVPIVDSVKGAYALLNDPKLKAEFEAAGVTSFNFYNNADKAYKSLVELNGGKELDFKNPLTILKAIGKNLEGFSSFIESATRMGEFKRAREAGKSIDEAARAARELTLDFSRSGVYGENVNQVVPFFNACIQGGDKLCRLSRDNPVGTAVNVFKYIVAPSLVLWLMNHDDEEYKELDPKVKLTHWIIGDVRIPKPQEAGVLFGSGIEAMLDLATGQDKDAMKNWALQALDGLTPNIIPTLFLPIVEWQANYSFFRDGKLVGYREEKLPDELQYKNSTSELSKAFGKLTGLSPIKIDNTVRGYTGTMGMLIWQAYDLTSLEKANLPEKKIIELPLIRDFFVNEYNKHRSVDEFYDMMNDAEKQHAGYGAKGKPTAYLKGIRATAKKISDLRKDNREITASPRLTPEAKRKLIDRNEKHMKMLAERANKVFYKFVYK